MDNMITISSIKYFNSKEEMYNAVKKHHEIINEDSDPYGSFSVTILNKKSNKYASYIFNPLDSLRRITNSHKKFVF